ncbi:MAG: threonine synthase, partial [Bauldia sp.]
SSNFARLLFEAYGRDAAAIRDLMDRLATTGAFDIAPGPLAAIRRDFAAGTADEAETARTIAATFAETGFLPDPHTAVGLSVAERFAEPGIPMVTLATADPAKFPEAVTAAAGVAPPLPASLAGILNRNEQYVTLANDRLAVEDYIAARSRASAPAGVAESVSR